MDIPKDLFISPDIDRSQAIISFTWPENTYNWLIYGSCKRQQLHDSDREDNPTYKITRGINSARPTVAHEN